MWVDVVSLRRDGNKLPPEQVRAATPLRARLTVDTVVVPGAAGEPARRADVAQLWADASAAARSPLGTLEFANVSRVGGAGLMVVGVEASPLGPARPQAWWCRIVLHEAEAAAEAPSEWRHTWPGSLPAPLTDAIAPHAAFLRTAPGAAS